MKKIILLSILGYCFAMVGCQKEEYGLPVLKDALQNDALKRKFGPNIAGQYIDFAYAIAIPATKGKIVSAQVEASIPGGSQTYFDPKSYYTNTGGVDVGVEVAGASVNNGNITSINLTKDTNAVTFRYYYQVPEPAKGQEVSFTFSAKSSNGETVSYKLGPYAISRMDMVRTLPVSDNNLMFISIADMKVYNAVQAAANPEKIDLVYSYKNISGASFNHALVAPSASEYLTGITLPQGVNNDSKLIRVFGLQDRDLSQLQYALYVDDADLVQKDFSTAPNFALDMKVDYGLWVETADKKYRAYVYINSVNNSGKSAVVSMKRIAMN